MSKKFICVLYLSVILCAFFVLNDVPAEQAKDSVILTAKTETDKVERVTNSIGMTFVYIKPGTFFMGSPPGESGRKDDEVLHKVTLTQGFYMQTTEVTQKQWKNIMQGNPSKCWGDDHPVEQVSWDQAQEFISKLNAKEGHTKYRLPTEAEWEYACRAGTYGRFNVYGASLKDLAWYSVNFDKYTHQVACKKPNAWGLYDMHGNVLEWCADWRADYPTGHVTDPKGPAKGEDRIYRGGCFTFWEEYCRSADRLSSRPGYCTTLVGFRLVRNPEGVQNSVSVNQKLI